MNGRPIHTSTITDLRRAMLSINFGRVQVPTHPGDVDDPRLKPLPTAIWRLVSQISTARRLGATTLDLCYVAQGAFEGYVDLRNRLTPENFLAPALIIEEAGGFFGSERGKPLGPVQFTTGYRVLATGNRALLEQIVQALALTPG
jgi:myo-inositol-1(or 4)-monophosphatase